MMIEQTVVDFSKFAGAGFCSPVVERYCRGLVIFVVRLTRMHRSPILVLFLSSRPDHAAIGSLPYPGISKFQGLSEGRETLPPHQHWAMTVVFPSLLCLCGGVEFTSELILGQVLRLSVPFDRIGKVYIAHAHPNFTCKAN